MISLIEQEVKFLEVNPSEIRNKLLALGAKHSPEEMTPYRIFDFLDKRMAKNHELLRLRCEHGKVIMAWKKRLENMGSIKQQQEIEVNVSDYEQATSLLENMGLIITREWEKKRESFDLDGVKVDMDTLPPQLNIPTFIEIEGNPAAIERIAKELGLNMKDGKAWEGVELLKNYGHDFEKIKSATFAKISYY